MAYNYTRQSSFADGDTINSSLFNDEYDRLVLAFRATDGHTHDGSTAQGGPVNKVGPTQDIIISATSILPKTTNTVDLGSSTFKFKDAYFAGNITADGSITYNGNVTIGNDIAADTLTINATIQGSYLLFEGATAGVCSDVTYTTETTCTTAGKTWTEDAHELKLAIPDVTSDVTITLPDSTQTLVGKTTTDTLTNKTLTSPTINTPTITGNTTFSDGLYDFDIASHDGTNGLKLGGTLVTATATELNLIDGVTATTAELNIMDGVTATATELNLMDGVTATTAELNLLDGVTSTTSELNLLDGVTSTTSELNILDGVTSTATEINLLDGVTATTTEINILDGVTATATELNLLDGVTSTTAELNILDGVTSTSTEINLLDGVTATTAELNILDGVTSTATEINLLDGVTAIKDEDNMSSDSDTALATQQSIKKYVDDTVTAQDLDFQGDSGGALNIDLDSETLDIAGGTGIDTSGASNTLTVAIDSTVVTKTGTQTLTNKTLTSPEIGTKISDTNGNELLKVTATASAVNELTLANAVATAGPTLSATGDDTNIDINITPKGTGEVNLSKVDIDSGTIDGTTIATSDVTVGTGKTLDVSAGTLTTSSTQKKTIIEGAGSNVDIGAYSLTAKTLVSDVADGTSPLTVTSTTKVTNLNADLLDGATLDTTDTLGTSDTKIPSQKAVKTYVDAKAHENTTYTAGDGLDLSTTTFKLDLKANSGLKITSTELDLDLDASGITGTLGETDGGTNQSTYTAGDILYASASNTLSKLAKGSDGEVLKLASGIPSWAADTNTTYTAGDGLDLSTTTFKLDLKASGGLKITSTELEVDFGTSATSVAKGNHTHTGVYDAVGTAVAMAIALG